MTPEGKIQQRPNWIAGKRFGNSLKKLVERYPEGAPDRVAAAALLVPEEEVEGIWQRVVAKLRSFVR